MKIIRIAVSLLMILALSLSFTVFAAGEAEETLPARTEIAFRVGDDVLVINGEDVKVETAPYVVGVGVTLVPVRVITEAFGAKVGWEEATETVTLDYPDVNIVLQIGNPVAEVNGKAETLLAAPELSPEGRTMIPLRFISENFGAVVTYDDETEAITVVKETAQEGGILEGRIEEPFVGDSYYGWSMETPADMDLSFRADDGSYLLFTGKDGATIWIEINPLPKDYDLGEDFDDTKKAYADEYTLTSAEKREDGMRFCYRYDDMYCDSRFFVGEKYLFRIDIDVKANDPAARAAIAAIADSFRLSFDTENAFDLSDVDENGMRLYKNENMKLSVRVPVEFLEDYGSSKINRAFLSSDNGAISIQFFSLSEYPGTKAVAETVRETILRGASRESVAVSRIIDVTYGSERGSSFFADYTFSDGVAETILHFYFEKGAYAYEIAVDVMTPGDDSMTMPTLNNMAVALNILNSIELEELDPEETGLVLYTEPIEKYGETVTRSFGDHALDLPGSYSNFNTPSLFVGTALFYAADPLRGVKVDVTDFTRIAGLLGVTERTGKGYAELIANTMISAANVSRIGENYRKERFGGKDVYYLSLVSTPKNDKKSLNDIYIIEDDGTFFAVEVTYPESYDTDEFRAEFRKIAESFRPKNADK